MRRVLLALFFTAASVVAQPSAATVESFSDPSFFIESIDLGATRANRGPLRTALRLAEGRTYRESDLRQAVDRVRRLPFVLDAQMSLEKGSARERYVLVVHIEETSRFFLVSDSTFRYRPSQRLLLPSADSDVGEPQGAETFTRDSTVDFGGDLLTAGLREFFGQNGALFATLSDERVAVGYTQYNLFGSRAFGTVAVGKAICCDGGILSENDFGVVQPADLEVSGALGIPIARNHSLQLNLSWADADAGSLGRGGQGVDARWFFDTTDDPFFPTRGVRATGALGLFDTELSQRERGIRLLGETEDAVASLSAVRYFQAIGQTFWVGAEASFREREGFEELELSSPFSVEPQTQRFSLDGDELSLGATFGWARTLLAPVANERGELRLETTLDLRHVDRDLSFQGLRQPDLADELESSFVVSLAYRNRFAVVRFGLGYSDGGEP